MKKVSCSSMKGLILAATVCLLAAGQVALAEFVFGEPTKVPNINSSSYDGGPHLSFDGLELYFGSNRLVGGNDCHGDIYVARRSSINEPWSTPVKLDFPGYTAGPKGSPCLAADGLELYFSEGWPQAYAGSCTPDPDGYGSGDLWVSKRATKVDPWGQPANLGPVVNSASPDDGPALSADGLSLYFASGRAGGYRLGDIYVTTRQTKADPWGPPQNLGPDINKHDWNIAPSISPDGLSLFYSESKAFADMWVSTRATTADPWSRPVAFDLVNQTGAAYYVSFAPGIPTIYFGRGIATFPEGSFDIWQIEVTPIVDFTGDYKVNIEDLVILIENWGQHEASFDIAPAPWGDGVVGAEDLEVLMSHWGQDANFIAHWKLDETGGNIAYNSIGDSNAIVMGDVLWDRESGQVDGALQFDGVSTYVSGPFILNPRKVPFSVFAWIKGGEAGQSIISQEDGSDWLAADISAGQLSTSLLPPLVGRFPVPTPPLVSDTVITDGNWHRVGLVWDELVRILYVDDVEVARDVVGYPESSDGGLYIGTGSNRDSVTFWSGLIDDVRVYDCAVTP